MRVLYFHQHFTTPDGSGGTRSYEFARALIGRGHRVTMVCGLSDRSGLDLPFDPAKNWSRGDIDGIDVIALPLTYSNRDSLLRRTLVFLRFAWRSTWLALREDYDLLFATSTPLTAGIPGIVMKCLGQRKKFVFEVRDLWPELPRALGMRNPLALTGMSVLEWLSYRTANACVGLSPGIVEGIQRRAPRTTPVILIPNGCDLNLFHPVPRKDLSLPGIKTEDFVAAFMGAQGVANGLDAVLDAGAILRKRGRTDIKLLLIGDGKEHARLKLRAEREGLPCYFIPPVKKKELAALTARLGCGLMILADIPAFYYGTSPNKFFDYVSAGLPVLCNYPGWLADLIEQHHCGVTVPPGNAEAFADALCRLAGDGGLRETLGRNARAMAEREFGRPALAACFVALVERTITPPAMHAGVRPNSTGIRADTGRTML